MKIRHISLWIVLPAMLAAMGSAIANDGSQPVRLEPIMQRQRQISELVEQNRDNLGARQEALIGHALLKVKWVVEGHQTLNELSPNDRVRLKNALATVDAMLDGSTQADERRLICKRERVLGSAIKTATCMTVGGTERDLEQQLFLIGIH